MDRKRNGYWLWVFGLILILTSCGGNGAVTTSPTSSTGQDGTATVRTVTTMSILADFVKQVGGDRVQVENIIPVGASAENYQPTPQDARTISQAQVIFFNGHGLEAWLDRLFASAGSQQVLRVELSHDIAAINSGDGDFKQGNPHFWLNPQYAATYVAVIRDTLTNIDPAGSSTYAANAARYTEQLNTLDRELMAQAATVPVAQRKMVTNHDAFPYFAQHYGFTIVGNILGNPEGELAAGDLANLVQAVRQQQVKAVFAESQFSPRVSQTLAKDADVKVVATLYTDSLSKESAAASYIAMMRYDMQTIVAALTSP